MNQVAEAIQASPNTPIKHVRIVMTHRCYCSIYEYQSHILAKRETVDLYLFVKKLRFNVNLYSRQQILC